jgi:hypothetical protein
MSPTRFRSPVLFGGLLLQLVPKIYDVMRQAPSDPASTEPFQELLDVIKTAIG